MKHLLLFIFLLTGVKIFSQTADSNAFSSLAAQAPGIDSSNYILVIVSGKTSVELRNKIMLHATRTLPGNSFIINKKYLSGIIPGHIFFDQFPLSNNNWKLSPAADELRILKAKAPGLFRFMIAYSDPDFPKQVQEQVRSRGHISNLPSLQILSVTCTYNDIEKIFLNNNAVLSIDVSPVHPKEELAVGGFDLSANKVNMVHSRYAAFNGSGQHVSIKENFYDTADIDLKGRLDPSPLASAVVTNHANFMATIIAGGGNSVHYAKGAAWAAGISSSSFDQVLPDPTSYYSQNNITVQNHSYGTSIESFYGLSAQAFDKSANENPILLHVFSSGNSGEVAGTSGAYSGITGFANLTGNFKMSKNAIVVGAADSFGVVVPPSSKGPAYDGRVKPELIAFETNGTSEAAAMVSGAALLLQQYYKNKNTSGLPSALAKAILINSADDVNTPGPDYATGFGNLNAFRAMNIIRDNSLFTGTATQNSQQSFLINVPSNIAQVKVTLVWNDTAAATFAYKALVNDLDLTVVSASTNEVWQPWVLSPVPNIDSLIKLPQRKRDSLNNVEQVTLQDPAPGTYKINVQGFNVPVASQKFYIAYSVDTAGYFKWMFPSDVDFLETGRSNIVRWENSVSGTGDIEYNIPGSSTWNPVSTNTNLQKKYFKWTPPDTTARCLLRMKIGSSYFYSDTFLIASLPAPKVGFVCPDTILLYWNRIKGISQYQVYQLGNKYMDPFIKVSDTAALLLKSSLTGKYFSVGTIVPGGIKGPASYAFDYSVQGTGCFIKTFFADANGKVAKLTLILGTTYKIKDIVFQRSTGGMFITIDSLAPGGQTFFVDNYQPLSPGITLFRARITLQSGEIIYSDTVSVFYVDDSNYILLPVPVKRGNDVEILTSLPSGEVIRFFDATGRAVLQKEIQSAHEHIKTSLLPAGQYFYRITKIGREIKSGKLLIL